MSSSATQSGLVIFLLSITVVHGQHVSGVTYSSTQTCAPKGSTVDIPCTYTYPPRWNGRDVVVASWFRQMNGNDPVDLRSDSDYTGRVEYHFRVNGCTLRIKDLRESDSAEYKFTLRTNKPDQSLTGSPGVSLSVTDLQVTVINSTDYRGQSWAELKCHSSCHVPAHLSYIWYRNGRTTFTETSSFSGDVHPADSFACALRGHEGSPSPAVCVEGENCNRVTYADRRICAFEGSSVDISCTYSSSAAITSKFWFNPERSQQWKFPARPEDLKEDTQFGARIQVIETERGHSTLRITDLRQTDSTQYHFTFITKSVEWSSVLPATTLTVTALQVQVNKVAVGWTSVTAELKCHSSCSPAGQLSYIWFKSGEKIQTETFSLSGSFDSVDSYACALKGHEDSPSPPVCVHGGSCKRVTYAKRRICALKGSSVDISCTYYPYWDHSSLFWFSPARSHHWQNPTQPEDLKEDSQYEGRVQVFKTQTGRSTLRISDLRESDSAEYRFKFKRPNLDWGNSFPGTTLTVTALQVQVTLVTVLQDYTEAVLRCHHSCPPAGDMSYIWFKNGQKIQNEEKSSHEDRFYPGDFISCAVKGLENDSPSVYALKAPSVSVSPPGEIMKGSSVTLKCSSDANREANYTWLKRNQTLPREEPQLVFTSIQPSDSGEYRCTAENELGKRTSEPVFIDVKYAPQLPSVSVSPSVEIMEGSSVTLTCSSDANPAANYTWYKENEDSPKAVGPVFIITESRAERSGNYYCEAHNGIGRHNSTLLLIVVAGAWTSTAVGTSLAVVFTVLLLVVFILIRKKRASKRSAEIGETAGDTQEQCLPSQSTQEEQELNYCSVQFITNPEPESLYSCVRPVQPEPLYSCVRPVQPEPESLYSCVRPVQRHGHQQQEDQDVVYAAVTINKRTSALS